MDSLNFNSVETLPNLSARAAFQVNSSAVFKEDVDIVPVVIGGTMSSVPWGGDNMPFDIWKPIEDDEMLTCRMFNAEVCFGRGLAATLVMLPPPSRAKSRIEGKFLQKITIFKAPQGFGSRDPMDLIQDPK